MRNRKVVMPLTVVMATRRTLSEACNASNRPESGCLAELSKLHQFLPGFRDCCGNGQFGQGVDFTDAFGSDLGEVCEQCGSLEGFDSESAGRCFQERSCQSDNRE